MTPFVGRITGASRGVCSVEAPDPAAPPSRNDLGPHNDAASDPSGPRVMHRCTPIPDASCITDAPRPTATASPVHHADALFLAARVLSRRGRTEETCYRCGGRLSAETDLLCCACYAARREPGRVLAFDPDRRRRTALRLAGHRCRDCHTADWHTTARGDATCQTCALRRVGGAS